MLSSRHSWPLPKTLNVVLASYNNKIKLHLFCLYPVHHGTALTDASDDPRCAGN